MIGFIKALASLRNVAILAGLMATAFAVQSLRIKHKNSKIETLKAEKISLEVTLSNYQESQTTNIDTIAELQQVNQQCAAGKKINEANSKQELTRQQQRIADLQEKYSKAQNYANKQKADRPHICGYKVYIDPKLLDILHQD